ncbi:hypothetical protein [Catenulispora sp. GAS73]|uniref:hypothetical protein n=1 Tax=Catenulispora sp. GAS73 TaxID=3156269 RepID=UPI0035182418
MRDVLVQDNAQVALTGDEDAVGAFTADGADEPFGDGVHRRGLRCGRDRCDASGTEQRIEHGGELGIAVSDEMGEAMPGGFDVGGEVPCELGGPGGGRMPGDAEQVDPTRAMLDVTNAT